MSYSSEICGAGDAEIGYISEDEVKQNKNITRNNTAQVFCHHLPH